MSVADTLKDLRGRYPDCDLVAFADLTANMVLVTSADDERPREAMDGLCEQATRMLGYAAGDTAHDTALTASETGVLVFLRATAEHGDVLCCECSAGIDMTAFLGDARQALDTISGGSAS